MTHPAYEPLYLFIDGQWLPAEGRDTATVINPADGGEIGSVPLATAADLDRALAAAETAQVDQRLVRGDEHLGDRGRVHVVERGRHR
ncbi:aldehyde dehydrogenase family protein, partial [Burkholderia gladioli]|nr:aldehyde dehydrogenase family protein [Burkholderia gladioli]